MGLFGEYNESACGGRIGDRDCAGSFGDEFAGLGFGLDDLGSAAATGHEETAPVVLKLARGHTNVRLKEGILGRTLFCYNDDYSSITHGDLFAEEDSLDALAVERLASKCFIADECWFGVEGYSQSDGH